MKPLLLNGKIGSRVILGINSALGSAAALIAVASLSALSGCAPNATQLKKAVENDPEIVFVAIEKNPGKFIEVVQKASMAAERTAQERAEKDDQERFEEEFKNPKSPKASADRAYRGKADAPILIVEYSDFQCPFCARGFNTLEEVRKKYGDKVRVLFKHLPLVDLHPMAMPAALRYEAIALQGADKAYKFHDEIFKNQQKLSTEGEKFLDASVKKVGADLAKVKKDMESDKVKARIAEDTEEASKFGISGTPGFVVGGVTLKGAYPAPYFDKIIERHLSKK